MADKKELVVVLKYDDSELQSGTQKTKNRLGELGRQVVLANVAYDAFKTVVRTAGQFLSDSLAVYQRTEAAMAGLRSTAANLGQDVDKANTSALGLASDGLVSIETSAASLRALMSTGLSIDKATDLMAAYKDEAAFGRSQNISFEQAVRNLAESFMTESSIIGNLSGQTENYNVILEIGARALGKKVSELTRSERQEAKYIGTLQVAKKAQGDSAKMADTLTGAQARYSFQLEQVHRTVGTVFGPAYTTILKQAASQMEIFAGLTKEQLLHLQVAFLNFFNYLSKIALGIGTFMLTLGDNLMANQKGAAARWEAMLKLMKMKDEQLTKDIQRTVDISSGRMKESVKDGAKGVGDALEDMSDKAAKEAKKFEKEMEKITNSFNESLEDMLFSKRSQREKLEAELAKENFSYEKSLTKTARANAKEDEKSRKQQEKKLKELQKDLDEEVAKGAEADQERIADLQERILIENTEYEEAKKERQEKRAEEAAEEKERHAERVQEMQASLNELRQLEEKYAEDFAKIKDKQKEDDIARLKRKFEEEKAELLKQHTERMAEFGTQGGKEGTAYADGYVKAVKAKTPEVKKAVEGFIISGVDWEALRAKSGVIKAGYQHGLPNVPASGMYLLHKGERVVPKTGADVAGSTSSTATVNFYGNLSVRSESDINEIASKVSRILGRQSELERWYG